MNIHTPIYTADDICELLSHLGLPKWNKKVLCGCGFDTREITNDDLADENVIHLYFEDQDKELPIKVSNFEFYVHKFVWGEKRIEDYSDNWIELLLKNYPDKYPFLLQDWSEKKIDTIKSQYTQDIDKLVVKMTQLKQKTDSDLALYESRLKIANQLVKNIQIDKLNIKLKDFKADLSEDMKDFNDNL